MKSTPLPGEPASAAATPETWREVCERARLVKVEYVQARLLVHQGNVCAVARDAGLPRTSMYRLITRYGLLGYGRPPRKPQRETLKPGYIGARVQRHRFPHRSG